jgi:hypothetical protein
MRAIIMLRYVAEILVVIASLLLLPFAFALIAILTVVASARYSRRRKASDKPQDEYLRIESAPKAGPQTHKPPEKNETRSESPAPNFAEPHHHEPEHSWTCDHDKKHGEGAFAHNTLARKEAGVAPCMLCGSNVVYVNKADDIEKLAMDMRAMQDKTQKYEIYLDNLHEGLHLVHARLDLLDQLNVHAGNLVNSSAEIGRRQKELIAKADMIIENLRTPEQPSTGGDGEKDETTERFLLKCAMCHHTWPPRTDDIDSIKQCPRCRSRKWRSYEPEQPPSEKEDVGKLGDFIKGDNEES